MACTFFKYKTLGGDDLAPQICFSSAPSCVLLTGDFVYLSFVFILFTRNQFSRLLQKRNCPAVFPTKSSKRQWSHYGGHWSTKTVSVPHKIWNNVTNIYFQTQNMKKKLVCEYIWWCFVNLVCFGKMLSVIIKRAYWIILTGKGI